MIASGEAPVRSTTGALQSPATSVISSFIRPGYLLKGRDTVFDSLFYQFCTVLFPYYPNSKLSVATKMQYASGQYDDFARIPRRISSEQRLKVACPAALPLEIQQLGVLGEKRTYRGENEGDF